MATYKAEFLAHYYDGRARSLQHYAFGFMDRWAQLTSALPGGVSLANAALRAPGLSQAMKAVLGVAPQRELPRFAASNFQKTRKRGMRTVQTGSGKTGSGHSVLLWPDTWNNYYHPQALQAADRVLGDAGFAVEVPKHHVCCGRPLYDFGFLREARAYLVRTMEQLAPQIDAGMPFVFLEPSCASVFRDELVNFFPNDERARKLHDQTLLLSEFLVRNAPDFEPVRREGQKIVLHGHCHHKSLMKMDDEVALLKRTGAAVELLDSGCCGMAGPFGFEKEKFEVSQVLGERVLLPAVRGASAQTLIVSDGFSCREQITQNTDRRAVHFAEAICGDL
jgi:Fe-S oxidoreductase